MCDTMNYEEALEVAKRNAESFPSGKDETGREWIDVDGRKYPKDWFLEHSARMKSNGEV